MTHASKGELASAVGVDPHQVVDLIAMLKARRLTVATAESLTGGLLAALLTEVPGSSAVVRGGLVAYAMDLKHSLVGVDETLLARRGAVDPEVAAQLAAGARSRCGAGLGIGLTGVAGPDPQDGQPVGTWFCALAGPGGYLDQRAAPPTLEPDGAGPARAADPVRDPAGVRREVRAAAVRAALEMLTNIPATLS